MRIGALISRSGPAGIWGPTSEACAILAAGELNASGGGLSAPVELVIADPGWTEVEAAATAAHLIEIEGVDAIVGMHPSNVRQAVKSQVGRRVPYYYTPHYEGGERASSTIAIGSTDSSLMRPTLPWFANERRAHRFCLIANDYVWPYAAMDTASAIIADAGGRVAGRVVLPFEGDCGEAIEAIRLMQPDVLVMLLLGSEMVRFNRAFADAGLHHKILRFGLGVDDHVLMGIGADGTEGLYAAATYISAERSLRSERLKELYRMSFGEFAPSLTVYGQSCYEGVHLAAEMARRTGTPHGPDVARYVAGLKRNSLRASLPQPKFDDRPRVYFVAADGIEWRIVSTN